MLLPTVIDSSWEYYFSGLEFKSYYFQLMAQHTKAIHEAWPGPKLKPDDPLSDEFWERLKKQSKYLIEIDDNLYKLWEKRKSFIHLSTQTLLTLLQDEILPLLQKYESLLTIVPHSPKNYSSWYSPDKNIYCAIQTNHDLLKKLKNEVNDELLFRCKLHASLKTIRQVDDVTAYFYYKINDLKLIEPLATSVIQANLSDDERLLIFDLLKSQGYKPGEIQEAITRIIPKEVYPALCKRDQIKTDLRETRKFCQQVLKDLNLITLDEYLFKLSLKTTFMTHWPLNLKMADLFRKIKKKWNEAELIKTLWKMRILLYLALTLLIYNQLIFFLEPLKLYYQASTIIKLTQVLFYTVGLAPLWWLAWRGVCQVFWKAHQLLTQRKVQEILSSLGVLEKSELFLSNQLSHSILDISHFNIDALKGKIESEKLLIQEKCQRLKYYRWGESFLSKGMIKEKIAQIIPRLEIQGKRIDQQAKLLAVHIASRIGEDIKNLVGSLHNDKLQPLLSPDRIKTLGEFVERFSDQDTLAKFNENADITKKWLGKIENEEFSAQTRQKEHNFPWGGYPINQELIAGWDILLNHFISNDQYKNDYLALNSLLKGKREKEHASFTFAKLNQIIDSAITHPNEKNSILAKIQWFLYKTLNYRSPEHAALLSKEQKESIVDWYQKNEQVILEAKDLFSSIFDNPNSQEAETQFKNLNDAKLGHYYELLDGADIYAYVSNNSTAIAVRSNSARTFFENYDGKNDQAFRLIKWVPESEKAGMICQFAAKRINWLLLHPSSELSIIDQELFRNYRLATTGFKIKPIILKHACFDTYNPKLTILLESFKKSGLIKHKLLEQYKTRDQGLGQKVEVAPTNQEVKNDAGYFRNGA